MLKKNEFISQKMNINYHYKYYNVRSAYYILIVYPSQRGIIKGLYLKREQIQT